MALAGDVALRLEAIAVRARACTRCALSESRTQAVPGEGTGNIGILLVGEAPGRTEDETGRPFCGAAGRNLDLALAAAHIERGDTFVTSIVKCRPPENRDPTLAEKAACRPYLVDQIKVLRPRVIVALGRHGLSAVVPDAPKSFTELAGGFCGSFEGVPVWVSLHPAAVIYRQAWKEKYLDDWRRFGGWVAAGMPASDTEFAGRN